MHDQDGFYADYQALLASYGIPFKPPHIIPFNPQRVWNREWSWNRELTQPQENGYGCFPRRRAQLVTMTAVDTEALATQMIPRHHQKKARREGGPIRSWG
jgi:hypothetical protein